MRTITSRRWRLRSVLPAPLALAFALACLAAMPTPSYAAVGSARGEVREEPADKAFPATGAVDTFDGRKARLAPNWFGSEGMRGYRVRKAQVEVSRGGPIYWREADYGPDQEAYLTLTKIDPNSRRHGLLLKVQRNNWRRGAISVAYDARDKVIVVETFSRTKRAWTSIGRYDRQLSDGALLGARALSNGCVQVYVGGALIGTADAGSSFASLGGRIGVWFVGSTQAVFDDFGGGNVPK